MVCSLWKSSSKKEKKGKVECVHNICLRNSTGVEHGEVLTLGHQETCRNCPMEHSPLSWKQPDGRPKRGCVRKPLHLYTMEYSGDEDKWTKEHVVESKQYAFMYVASKDG